MKKINSLLKIIFLSAMLIFILSCSAPPKDTLIHDTAVILNQSAQSLSLYNFKTAQYQIDAIALHGGAPRGLFYDSPSTHAYITSSTANHVEVFNIDDGNLIYSRSISMPKNCSPYDAHDFGDNAKVYVTCVQTGNFLKISLDNDHIEKTTSQLMSPQAFAMIKNKIYVLQTGYDFSTSSYHDGIITVFDENLNLLETHPMAGLINPQDLLFLPGNILHILITGNYGSNSKLAVYSLGNLSTPQQTIDLGKSGLMSFSKDEAGEIYLWGYAENILHYNPNTIKLDTFFSMGDFKGHSGETPQGVGFYKDSVILSLGDFMNYNDILLGEKNSIRSNYKKLNASAGTSFITVLH